MNARKLGSLVLVIVLVVVARLVQPGDPAGASPTREDGQRQVAVRDDAALIAEAFGARRSDVQVQGSGVVERVLADDNDGGRHQRFILRLAGGQTVLVAHNIDLAPRLRGLDRGDTVAFFGEYEWNANGGVIHWTHHDPAGRHIGGWLRHEGTTVR